MTDTLILRRFLTLSLLSLLFGAIASCSTVEPGTSASEEPTPVVSPLVTSPTPASVILTTSDWTAWANFMPGIDTPSLHIKGQVQLPHPGYEVSLDLVAQTQAIDTLVYNLKVQEKTGNWAQVITTKTVRYEDSIYTGNDKRIQIHLPDGSVKELPLERTY
ncbi:MAG: hypothetical protein SAJ12_10185 [Jaaginema sp. PMC 1079.18]|nr:hypothetical protein [Jaaginema sp. PMC 1080.18]MEC4851368.1 hypothetical protein [Jaaginema sp. PMC 1079.18]MEC4868830.1 hypothetical protein [Jaaginema sp. PMC 1078.18]